MKSHFLVGFVVLCTCISFAGCMTDWSGKSSDRKVAAACSGDTDRSVSDNLRSLARTLGIKVGEDESDLELMSDMRLCLDAAEVVSCPLLSDKTIGEVSRYMELDDEKTLRANEALLKSLQGKRILILNR